jgi:hypothetical protein
MKYLKLFENFESNVIPQDILDKLYSTDHTGIMESLEDLKKELSNERPDDSKLRAYVDDIGVYLDETNMPKKEADDIYFSLVKMIDDLNIWDSFYEEIDYDKYLYLVEDILILEEATAGSVDNPNSKAAKMIKKKSEQSGIPAGILKKVYKRGNSAWNAGHRPGTPQAAWATGRVNSFITGAGGARKADADLWKKAKAAKAKKKKKK